MSRQAYGTDEVQLRVAPRAGGAREGGGLEEATRLTGRRPRRETHGERERATERERERDRERERERESERRRGKEREVAPGA